MWRALAVSVALATAGPLAAQEAETLADIRQDLTVLNLEIQRLKTELSTTSGASVISGGTLLDRVGLIEGALQELTAKTEQLEFRINRIVEDGTNRIGDLEFRLVELEGGDVSQLGETSTLGGAEAAPGPIAGGSADMDNGAAPSGGEVAVAEQTDFDAAQALLASEDYDAAAAAFERFTETYPGGPFEVAALMGRGDALAGLGNTRDASRAYLAAYNAAPQAETAPAALLKLGAGLSDLAQTDAACQIFAQLTVSFPTASEAALAQERSGALACP